MRSTLSRSCDSKGPWSRCTFQTQFATYLQKVAGNARLRAFRARPRSRRPASCLQKPRVPVCIMSLFLCIFCVFSHRTSKKPKIRASFFRRSYLGRISKGFRKSGWCFNKSHGLHSVQVGHIDGVSTESLNGFPPQKTHKKCTGSRSSS